MDYWRDEFCSDPLLKLRDSTHFPMIEFTGDTGEFKIGDILEGQYNSQKFKILFFRQLILGDKKRRVIYQNGSRIVVVGTERNGTYYGQPEVISEEQLTGKRSAHYLTYINSAVKSGGLVKVN